MWPRSTSVAATMPDQRNTVWGHVRSNATSSSSLRKEACHDPGHIDVDVYRDARGVELDRNLFRDRRSVRHVEREQTLRLDWAFSRQHGADERDRVLLSLRTLRATPCGRRRLAGGAGRRDPRAVCLSPWGSLALGLRGRCRAVTLSECLRRGGAGVREGAVPEPAGADAVRAALPCHAAHRRGDIRGAWHSRRDEVPPCDDEAGVSRRLTRQSVSLRQHPVSPDSKSHSSSLPGGEEATTRTATAAATHRDTANGSTPAS